MSDLGPILALWRDLESARNDYVLATVVEVQGSSYRRPGARMLLARDGRRAGTVSGGCLEAEVVKRAWWLTENGPVVERYSTLEDDGDLPYGSGCGGVVFILLERRSTAHATLEVLAAAFEMRAPLAIAHILEGPRAGHHAFAGISSAAAETSQNPPAALQAGLQRLADAAFADRQQREDEIMIEGAPVRVFVEYRPPRTGLWIFGAGDDAAPLLHLARELGWFVAIADGRSHLATANRFPDADEVLTLSIAELQATSPPRLDLHPGDAAVLMTHSFEQDSRILAFLLDTQSHRRPAYIGVLGPQRRTREVIAEAARLLGLAPTAGLVEEWLEGLHAPTGLDLGAEAPASVALSILSEIQKTLTSASALPLCQVRATNPQPARI
ncbi:MAG TPA: XdhC family protein [Terracidiphilus sp.]|nr:XdhC family protein [Terracidiphilus sp.]